MIEVVQSDDFKGWLMKLRDRAAAARIVRRLERLAGGNFGDAKSVGDGVHELRFMFGPGYRVYYAIVGQTLVIVLAGGDKSTQADDIARARVVAARWRE